MCGSPGSASSRCSCRSTSSCRPGSSLPQLHQGLLTFWLHRVPSILWLHLGRMSPQQRQGLTSHLLCSVSPPYRWFRLGPQSPRLRLRSPVPWLLILFQSSHPPSSVGPYATRTGLSIGGHCHIHVQFLLVTSLFACLFEFSLVSVTD